MGVIWDPFFWSQIARAICALLRAGNTGYFCVSVGGKTNEHIAGARGVKSLAFLAMWGDPANYKKMMQVFGSLQPGQICATSAAGIAEREGIVLVGPYANCWDSMCLCRECNRRKYLCRKTGHSETQCVQNCQDAASTNVRLAKPSRGVPGQGPAPPPPTGPPSAVPMVSFTNADFFVFF